MQAGLRPVLAAVTAGILFGLIHSPNWALVAVTVVLGTASCVLFQRNPNIFTLGAAHGLVGTMLHYCWPAEWLHKLTIGAHYYLWS